MVRTLTHVFILISLFTLSPWLGAQDTRKIWGNDRKAITLFSDDQYEFRSSWLKIGKNDKERVEKLIELLSKSSTGEKVVFKAKMKALELGSTLEDLVLIGEGSLTDTTLVRRFLPSDIKKVDYESRSVVYINRSHNLQDALLDFAHELTHFSFRTAFNPYVVNFNLKDFIKSTIEGRGGEVDAYMVECKVLQETFSENTWRGSNCSRLLDEQGKLSRAMTIQKFYQVGNHLRLLKKELGQHLLQLEDFPQVNDDEAQYISSAYGVPYPLAALREYASIMERSCLNDYKRMALLRDSKGRSPASQIDSSDKSKMTQDFKKRCSNYLTEKMADSF